MRRGFTVMTALPPTKGHQKLIEFTMHLTDSAEVILCTQPEEPFSFERLSALREANKHQAVTIHHLHRTIPQTPADSPVFWEMWREILTSYGMQPGDVIVTSEPYGEPLAKTMGAAWYPFDLERTLCPTRATSVRTNPRENFSMILPEFQQHLKLRVSTLGALGNLKSLSELSDAVEATTLFSFEEMLPTWATVDDPVQVWESQVALMKTTTRVQDRPFILTPLDPLMLTLKVPALTHLQDVSQPWASEVYLVHKTETQKFDRFLKNAKTVIALDSFSVLKAAAELTEYFDRTRTLTYQRRGQ